jgi:hypothetical protein
MRDACACIARAGVEREDMKNTNLAQVKGTLKAYVKKFHKLVRALMPRFALDLRLDSLPVFQVNDNWHDGYEEQGQCLNEYFWTWVVPMQSIVHVVSSASRQPPAASAASASSATTPSALQLAVERCDELLLAISDK